MLKSRSSNSSVQLPLHWFIPTSSAFLGFFLPCPTSLPPFHYLFFSLWKKRSLKPTEILLFHSNLHSLAKFTLYPYPTTFNSIAWSVPNSLMTLNYSLTKSTEMLTIYSWLKVQNQLALHLFVWVNFSRSA